MRRLPVVFVSFLLWALVAGIAGAQVADVPADHWAYRAVQTLVERGYIDLAGDGTFRGEEPADRYQLAAVVGRLLEDIEAGRVRVREGTDVELVRQLEEEFRAELVAWHAERDKLEEAYLETQRAVTVIDVQLNDILAELERLELELADLIEREEAAKAELRTALDALGVSMEEALAARDARLADHDAQLELHSAELARHSDELAAQAAQVTDLYSKLSENTEALSQRLDDFQEAVRVALEEQGISLGEEFGQQLDAQRTALEDVDGKVRALQAEVDQLRTELDALELRLEDEVQGAINRLNELAAALAWRIEEVATALTERLDAEAAALSEELAAVRSDTDQLSDSLTALEQLVATMDARSQSADEGLLEALAQQENQVTELRSRLDQVEQQALQDTLDLGEALTAEIHALRAQLDQVEAELAAQREQMQQQAEALTQVDAQFLQDINALRQELQATRQRSDILESQISANQAAISLLRRDVEQALAQRQEEQAALRRDLDAVQSDVRDLQNLLGSSEEYIANLLDQLQRQMDTQLSSSVAREQLLRRQLAELQQELESLRSQSDEELGSLRSTGTLAVSAAVLALLVGLSGGR